MIDRAVIGAWVGSSNLGDELIFSILVRLLKEKGELSILPVLEKWLVKHSDDKILLEGLWIY